MSYIVFCTFDLKSGSRQDYDNAYADLKKIGLARVAISTDGQDVVIPTTSVIGEFNGASAGQVRDDMRNRIRAAFTSRGFRSELFVLVGGDWAWGAAKT